MSVNYTINRPISHVQFIDVLNRSTLGERRPTDDRDCMKGMLDHSNLVVCAWDDDSLIKALIDRYRQDGSLLQRRGITAPGSTPVEG